MEKHYDLINVYASNKVEANEIVLEFLKSYNKKAIRIFKIKKKRNQYQAEVRYYDEYDISSVFTTDDFKELDNSKVLSLQNKKY